jgi:hypothetical protein
LSSALKNVCWQGVSLLGVLLLVIAGCSKGRPSTYQVTGAVIYQGQPVAGATVMFIPKNTRPANGMTDAQGRFTLLSFQPEDGAVAGEHVVCVTKFEQDSKEPAHAMNPKMRSVLPQKYASPLSSPLRVTVTKEGQNDFRLELKD